MKRYQSSLMWALSVAGIAVVLLPASAHAQYLDPGAGSIIVQAVIAAAIGAITAVKIYWNRISLFLFRRRKGV